MKVNTVYSTFMGEQNIMGIGSPVIFFRLQGCHLRCYKKTLGTLCDTPEGLEASSNTAIEVVQALAQLDKLVQDTGIKHVCLSGGDPMWNKHSEIEYLFSEFQKRGLFTTVETSGTLLIQNQFLANDSISFVLDYKLKSAGVKLGKFWDTAPNLRDTDYVKFVVYGEEDFAELVQVVAKLKNLGVKAKLVAGVYWGGPIGMLELFEALQSVKVTQSVEMNMQAHKLAVFYDSDKIRANSISIPVEI